MINASDPVDSATLSYDALGRMTLGIDPDWQSVQRSYDADNKITAATDNNGQIRQYYYDGDGKTTGVELEIIQNKTGALLDSGYTLYDHSGRKQQSIDAGGNISQYQYDSASNLIQITDPDDYTLGYSYDAANRWLTAYDKAGHTISRSLDAQGRPKTTTDANGNITTYSYWDNSRNGQLKQITQAAAPGFSTGISRQYDYNATGQVISSRSLWGPSLWGQFQHYNI